MEGQGRLLDTEPEDVEVQQVATTRPEGRVVRVMPDVATLNKTFDYLVPTDWPNEDVQVGSLVRVALHGRRVGGWIMETDVEPPAGVTLRTLAKLTGLGPPADHIELLRWVAWRWGGRLVPLLRSASPERVVRNLPAPTAGHPVPEGPGGAADDLFTRARAVVRWAPTEDVYPIVAAATRLGNALIITPSIDQAKHLAMRLRRAGVDTALAPRDWARAAGGATLVGSRAAALMPVADLAAVVVLDEHDETLREERAPTWHAREVAIERARRAGVPCVLVSPVPSLEALEAGELIAPSRSVERSGWPVIDILDRRDDDPVRSGLLSERLTPTVRGEGRIVCVLNRKGRSRLLACVRCGELATCDDCGSSVVQPADQFECRSCDAVRPVVCLACGGTAFKNLRAGVSRISEELEALANRPVVEVTAESTNVPAADLYVGTEAVLHRVHDADVVAFLDFDQELLATRPRAEDEAMALLIRAARLVGPRSRGGRVVVQTRQPKHPVLAAALHADPARLSQLLRVQRQGLRQPPFVAEAIISGQAAEAYMEAFGRQDGIQVQGPSDESWRLRADDTDTLCNALASVARPKGRLRIAVA